MALTFQVIMQDGSCGAIGFKASVGHILLGFRTGKLCCFSVCTPEAIGHSGRHGLVPFLWSLCGEEREYITFTMEELEAGISHPGSEPQPSTKTHQAAVSAQTFMGMVLKVSLTGFRVCMCWGYGQVMSPRNCPGLEGLGLTLTPVKKLLFAMERTAKMKLLFIKNRSCEITVYVGVTHESTTASLCDGHVSFLHLARCMSGKK